MASFEDIDNARKLLDLEEAATLKEIKQAYRKRHFAIIRIGAVVVRTAHKAGKR